MPALLFLVLLLSAPLAALAQSASAPDTEPSGPSSPPPVQLGPVVVEDKPWEYNRPTRFAHSLPEVDGTAITVTKKTSVEKLDAQPTVIDNNQRALFDRLPGIVIAEQQNPLQLNLSYRGLGNPQESEYVLSLQDGIPISSDWIGFPTLYYLPVPQTLDSIQMIRGGSGLLYGPEPQPVINYVSRLPSAVPLAGTTEQVGGSDALFSSFNRLDGTRGPWGYLADYSHRRSNGQRPNGAFVLDAGDVRLSYALDARQTLGLDVHAYSVSSGLPGFLTIQQFQTDPHAATTPSDHEWVDRYTAVLRYENAFTDAWRLQAKLWTGTQDLTTRSDAYTGQQAQSAQISDQRFYYSGLDTRLLLRWAAANALSFGTTLYTSRSPWNIFNDADPQAARDDRSGTPFYLDDRTTRYGALFAENVFRFGRFHLVASARFEHEEIGVDEHALPPFLHRAPIQRTYYKNVPLFGLGLGNDFGRGNETYLNLAQGFRPLRYLDVASPFGNFDPGNNPDPTKYLTYEAGVHGWPREGLYYDASLFWVRTQNRIESQTLGNGASVNVNSGNARSRGFEGELDYDWLRLTAAPAELHLDSFVNLSLLEARITQSQTRVNPADPDSPSLAGNTPSYAPHYVLKYGLTWRRTGVYQLSLVGQTLGSQYWADNNQPRRNGSGVIVTPALIPQYTVLDLSGDYRLGRHLRLLGGVSNLTDRTYYSRVFFVNGGIEPAPGRTFYAGAAWDF
ncbi:MAG: TonB-dependent receptor [Nevskia sp.]|nr:TonB-dependent receptor [Nevskia sp.]